MLRHMGVSLVFQGVADLLVRLLGTGSFAGKAGPAVQGAEDSWRAYSSLGTSVLGEWMQPCAGALNHVCSRFMSPLPCTGAIILSCVGSLQPECYTGPRLWYAAAAVAWHSWNAGMEETTRYALLLGK